jgi:hypothetical protein
MGQSHSTPADGCELTLCILCEAGGGGGGGLTSHAAVTHPRLLLQWVVKLHARHATPDSLHALLRSLREEAADADGFAELSQSRSHTCIVDDVESQQAYSTLVLEVRVYVPASREGTLRRVPICVDLRGDALGKHLRRDILVRQKPECWLRPLIRFAAGW